MLTRVRWLWRNLVRRREADADLRAELEAFCAERPQGARLEMLREEVRGARIGAGIEGWARDLRYAARMLRKAPMLAAFCIATFALGIGANTAVFSMANAFLFRTLPVPEPKQLDGLRIWRHGRPDAGMDPNELGAVRDQATSAFSGLTAISPTQLGLSVNGYAQSAFAGYVTGNFFNVLGVKPALGRFFSAPQGVIDRDPEVVLSYDYWHSRLGGDPGIVGKVAAVNGRAVTIVGVGPKDFHGISELFDTQAYLPMGLEAADDSGQLPKATPIARRRAGVSLPEAQAAMNLVAARIARAQPKEFHGLTIQVSPVGVGLLNSTGANPFPIISALFLSLAGLVLLLAAVNVTGLLLARASARHREMAVRSALGGGRGRLARQALLETLLLALAGGAAGMVLGLIASSAMSALPPGLGFPMVLDFSLDWRVFLYGLGAALIVAIAAGMIPALRAASADPMDALRTDRAGAGRGRQRLRSTLVAAQVAAALALLVLGGLFVRSLRHAAGTSLGFDPRQVWNFNLDAEGAGYNAARGAQYFAQLLPRARALPGVVSASLAQAIPFGLYTVNTGVRFPGAQSSPGNLPSNIGYSAVSDGYFAAQRIPLLQGRSFDAGDNASAPAVAVVSRDLARQLWPGADPIGRSFVRSDQPKGPLRVVGVAGNVVADFSASTAPFFYVPLAQNYSPQQTLQLRLAVGAQPAAVARAIERMDANVPVQVESMDETIDGLNGLYFFNLGARLATWLGLLGLALALVGVYGVVAFNAAQRTHEIGIRMALGARPAQVAGGILRQALAMVAGGIGVGLALAALIGNAASAFLVDVSGLDPLTFGMASLLLAATALAASLLPAWRAARADPLAALRCE